MLFQMEKGILCLTKGKKQIQIIEASLNRKGAKLHNTATLPLSEDSEEKTAEQLRKLLKEKKFKTRRVRAALLSDGIKYQRIVIPFMRNRELMTAVKQAAAKDQGQPVHKLYIDHKVIRVFLDRGIKRYEVLVASCLQSEIDAFEQLLLKAKLKPVLISTLSGNFAYESHTKKKKIEKKKVEKKKTESNVRDVNAYVYFAEGHTSISFIEDDQIVFFREFAVPAMGQSKNSEDDFFGDLEEKTNQAAIENSEQEASPEEGFSEDDLSRTSTEISRSLRYFQQNFREYRVSQLILCGRPVDSVKLEEALKSEKIPIHSYSKLAQVFCPKVTKQEAMQKISYFASELGLLLGAPLREKINFIPGLTLVYQFRALLASLVILLCCVCGLSYFYFGNEISILQQQIGRIETSQVQTIVQMKMLQQVEGKRKQHDQLKPLVTRQVFMPYRLSYVPFKKLSQGIPDQVILRKIDAIRKDKKWEGSISGEVRGHEIEKVRYYYESFREFLEKSPLFQDLKAPVPRIAKKPEQKELSLGFKADFQLTSVSFEHNWN
ncbi:MAG: pilus assembly protein PilM [SAR324 cluster bacterium]|nr:pilus assembly protein PilM [SAR324 cluster bacterium]